MMITRESDYAIRIIRALKDGELLPLEQICQRELVPKQFAYKILKKLERSGLVSIRRRRRRMYSEPKPGGSDPPGYH